MNKMIVDVDLLKVYRKAGTGKEHITTLSWGDPIEVGSKTGSEIAVRLTTRKKMSDGSLKSIAVDGFVSGRARFRSPEQNDIFRYSLVDVQQGDGAVLESPKGEIMLVDGGQNQMFARYLASRYPGTTKDTPLQVGAIVNTHTDSDHLLGLIEIHTSEKHEAAYKQIFIHPRRVFHNGLVKRTNVSDPLKAFGTTVAKNGSVYVTDVVDDVLALPKKDAAGSVQKWAAVLKDWSKNGAIEIKRLSDMRGNGAFSFLQEEGMDVEVLGPMEETVDGAPALALLHEPKKGIPGVEDLTLSSDTRRFSTSHTINGQSVILMLKYGNIRLLLTGDLNHESESMLVDRCEARGISLKADFLKVPHHGSADFSTRFLERVSPVMSVVSCGDENERAEYIHPRATLVGALGKYSRVAQPLIFVTELVAFLKSMGYAKTVDKKGTAKGGQFFSFKREAYGIVHLAFNKDRMLVFTHSGKRDLKEAYAYCVSSSGEVQFGTVHQV